jgi:hypothetical protein
MLHDRDKKELIINNNIVSFMSDSRWCLDLLGTYSPHHK